MIETRIYFSFHTIKQFRDIIKMINGKLEYYTLYQGVGRYKGINEPSRIIEILNEGNTIRNELKYKQIANKIKEIANQESVLITTKSINMEFI